jgi:RES domain-containing protein
MAGTVALAVLENLVHMSRQDFPTGYVCVAAAVPEIVRILAEDDLRTREPLRELSPQALGDQWLDSQESAVLRVQSVVARGEHNYLLNPAHPDFAAIVPEPPAIFRFDPRLFL